MNRRTRVRVPSVGATACLPGRGARSGAGILPARAAVVSAAGVVCLACLVGGCDMVGSTAEFDRVVAERDTALEEARELGEQNAELTSELADCRQQADTLRGLGDKRLERLFHVERIEIGQYTGGVDTDGEPGDDAVKVFLSPLDRDGSVLKAAGDVTLRLHDLAEGEGTLVGERTWTVDELSAQWASGFLTYHFSFVCPFTARPSHREITVHATFVDYLTGRTFTAQKACEIALPAGE